MKRFLLLLLSLLSLIVSYSQNQLDRVVYIYRNDGIFNAFYCTEIDSITYSFTDTDGMEHMSPVTQEIWTSDSTYRISLNVIDSVSFVKPEPSYMPNVIKLDEKYVPYILSSDSLSLQFGLDLPENLLPRKNDILLYEGFSDLFPDGFVGRVNSISNDFIVKCDSVEFEEVYDELVLLGDYVLNEDNQNSHAYRLLPRRLANEIPLAITIPLKHSFGPISIEGNIQQGIRVRIVTRILRGLPPYIEIQIKDEELGDVNITASAETSSFRQVGEKIFGISIPIPECPVLRFNFATSPFVKPELKAGTSFGYEWSSKGQTSYVFDGNSWQTMSKPRISDQKISTKAGFNGSIWYGLVESVHIATIKNFISVGTDIYLGPKISGNVNINIGDGIYSTSLYEALKDTKVDYSFRFESDIALKWRLNKNNAGYTPIANIIPGIEWYIDEKYLLPLFTKPECNLSKDIVNISSEVSRPLLIPCTVGFRLSNSEETIDTHYNDRMYWMDDDFSDPLTTSFPGLKYTNGKYKVCPMVKILGLEIEATPETEFNYGLYVTTGGATASFTEARCWGGISLDDDTNTDVMSITDECGFFYNLTGMPQNGNAKKVTCSLTTDGLFDGELTSLSEDTQYYFTAFIRVGDYYYYGETSSFKTKKREDPNPDPNPDPTPEAITGTHFGETTTSAVVECSYKGVPEGASCRVEYSSSGAYASSGYVANGNSDGTRAVTISGLKPNTEYKYCAYIELADKSSVYGVDSTFTTKALLSPFAITGDCYDLKSSSATIECTYQNIEEGAESWCLVTETDTDNQQVYEFGRFEGIKTLELNNLKPSTTYYYMAYVDYDGETYEAQNGRKSFTTLTPEAYVEEVDKESITTTSVQFDYGFSNVPQNADCYIAIQSENDEIYYYYSVSETEKDTYEFSGLQPSTTYTYWAYIEFDGTYWYGNSENFTTKALPIPSAITGNPTDITEKSASVECSFSDVPDNAQCGVRYNIEGDSDGDFKYVWGSFSEGEQEFNIYGLDPSTTYTYQAIIVCDGNTYLGDPRIFSTNPPDISGTWNVIETYSTRPFPGAEWQTKTREYSLTLNKDGSIQVSGLGYEYIAGSWGYGNGRFSATCHIIATQTQNSWDRFDGRADDNKNPQKITGTRYSGNMNQVTNVENAVGSFVMTK